MQQRQISRSEQKIQKMNSSMVAFRQLIENLRVKNQQIIKPGSSDINPEVQKQSSNQSRLCASETVPTNIVIANNITNNNLKVSSSSMPVFAEDEGIRLKVRGHVAGRDILNKKPTALPTSKFNQTVSNMKDLAKNKNIAMASSTANESQFQHPAIQQIKLLIKKQSSGSSKNQKISQSFFQSSNSNINMNMTTMPLIKQNFQQNRLNLRATALKNKIKDIDQRLVIKYCKQSKPLYSASLANQIFDFFDGLMTQTNVLVLSPFIKKFKNCIYFGSPISEDQTYEGFLYFYQNKIYYGQFLKGQKNGRGVQVIIDQQIVFKGIFKQGQKSGKFWVKKNDQNYVGYLQKGLYHGNGKLQTKQSVYEGQFQHGQKHGFGQQFFPKTGVKLAGYFDHGVFSKRSKSSFSHTQIQKAIKFRTPGQTKSVLQNNRNSFLTKRQRSSNKINQQQVQGTLNLVESQMQLYNHPFSSSANNFNIKKTPFNKQKIRSILPGMSHQKFIDPMPENCRDFDYSFDVSSKRDTESFSLTGINQGRNKVFQKQKRSFLPPFGQIQQQNNHLDTSALQQPLPMPCFFKK